MARPKKRIKVKKENPQMLATSSLLSEVPGSDGDSSTSSESVPNYDNEDIKDISAVKKRYDEIREDEVGASSEFSNSHSEDTKDHLSCNDVAFSATATAVLKVPIEVMDEFKVEIKEEPIVYENPLAQEIDNSSKLTEEACRKIHPEVYTSTIEDLIVHTLRFAPYHGKTKKKVEDKLRNLYTKLVSSKRQDVEDIPSPATSLQKMENLPSNISDVDLQQQQLLLLKKLYTNLVSSKVQDNEDIILSPATSLQELKDLSSKVSDAEFKTKMIKFMSSTLDCTKPGDSVRRIMRKVATNDVLGLFTYKGKKKGKSPKHSFQQLQISDCIIHACKQIHPEVHTSTIEDLIRKTLRSAPHRDKSAKKVEGNLQNLSTNHVSSKLQDVEDIIPSPATSLQKIDLSTKVSDKYLQQQQISFLRNLCTNLASSKLQGIEDIIVLPTTSLQELEHLSSKVSDATFKTKLIDFMSSKLYCIKPGDTVRRIMRKITINDVMALFSFKGRKKKRSFQRLKITDCIKKACKKIHPDICTSTIEELIAETLRLAPYNGKATKKVEGTVQKVYTNIGTIKHQDVEDIQSPATSLQELEDLSSKVSNTKFKTKMINFLTSSVACTKPGNTVRKIMRKIAINDVLTLFSYRGRKKHSFQQLQISDCIIKACRKIHPEVHTSTIEDLIAHTLRFASYKGKRRKKMEGSESTSHDSYFMDSVVTEEPNET